MKNVCCDKVEQKSSRRYIEVGGLWEPYKLEKGVYIECVRLFSASVEIWEQEWCEKILAFWWQHEHESSGCFGVFLSETVEDYNGSRVLMTCVICTVNSYLSTAARHVAAVGMLCLPANTKLFISGVLTEVRAYVSYIERLWTRLFANKAERQTETDYIQWNKTHSK